jgi:hypothetical protein
MKSREMPFLGNHVMHMSLRPVKAYEPAGLKAGCDVVFKLYLAKKGADADLRLTESGKRHGHFARSYWLLYKHVIYAFNFLDKIEESK